MLELSFMLMKEYGFGWAEISFNFMLIQDYMRLAKSVPTSINGDHKKHFKSLESGLVAFTIL